MFLSIQKACYWHSCSTVETKHGDNRVPWGLNTPSFEHHAAPGGYPGQTSATSLRGGTAVSSRAASACLYSLNEDRASPLLFLAPAAGCHHQKAKFSQSCSLIVLSF